MIKNERKTTGDTVAITAKDRYGFDIETVVGTVGDIPIKEREALGILHIPETDPATRVYLWTMEREDGQEVKAGKNTTSLLDTMVSIARSRRLEKEREARRRENLGKQPRRKSLQPVEFWAHNMRFDSAPLDFAVTKRGGSVTGIVTELGAHIMKEYEIEGEFFVLKDTMKITQSSLASSAKIVSEKKFDAGVDFQALPWDHEASAQELEYCQQDTHIVVKILRWMRSKDMRGMTVAGCSFDAYLTRFQHEHGAEGSQFSKKDRMETFRKFYPRLDPLKEEFTRKAYVGGFVHVNPDMINRTLTDVTVKDRRSSYPASAVQNRFPYGPGRWVHPEYICTEKEVCITQYLITKIKLKPGGIPFITIKGAWCVAPDEQIIDQDVAGERITLTSVDDDLMRRYYDVDLTPVYKLVFDTTEGVGKGFLSHHFVKKTLAETKGESTYHKYMCNAWTGRWGLKPETPRMICKYNPEKGIVRWVHEVDDKGETVMTRREPYFVPVVAFITAYSRKSLFDTIDKVGQERFIYCDTDSVHYVDPDYEDGPPEKPPTTSKDIIESWLGSWGTEGHFPVGKYIGPKAYIHADKDGRIPAGRGDEYLKCAGMPSQVKKGWESGPAGEPPEHTIEDFSYGFKTNKKLMARTVVGGIALIPTVYEIKDRMSVRLRW